jgi:hypothetical protein
MLEARPGVNVPKTEFFPSRGIYRIRHDAQVLRCGSQGNVYIIIGDGSEIQEIDRHGLLRRTVLTGLKPFAIGADGAMYCVEGHNYKDNLPVTIAKIDAATGALRSDFTWAGKNRLDAPRFYLGMRKDNGSADTKPGLAAHVRQQLRYEAKAAGEDEASFMRIEDLALDADENLYVADAGKGAVKVYRRDGYYMGELATFKQDGKTVPLGSIRRIAVSRKDGAVYVIVPGPKRDTSRLVKFDGW